MYDIHSHILPGIDDGSGNMSDSLEMAKLAAESGTKGIFATPHCNMPHYFDGIWNAESEEKLNLLRQAIEKKGIDIQLYPGQEIYLEDGFLQKLGKNELITLNRSRYVLTELDFYEHENDAYRKISTLAAEGYVPIVAHPERYAFIAENIRAVDKLRSLGALIQLNAGSLKGSFGPIPKIIAKKLLKSHLADFIASDAHSQYSRTPDLSHAHETVCENYSYDYADLLFNENPLKIINNYEIR